MSGLLTMLYIIISAALLASPANFLPDSLRFGYSVSYTKSGCAGLAARLAMVTPASTPRAATPVAAQPTNRKSVN